ncbi:MAG: hypothetical protein IPJ65_21930 [Archangiaceae bacterium]|nr:hypothetical protein [Archangiaceae bacterium]
MAATTVFGIGHLLGVDRNDLGASPTGSSPVPGARLVPGQLNLQTDEARPTWTVGNLTLSGATASELAAFTPTQQRVYDWTTRFAKHGNVELASKLANMARAPGAGASITLDAAAMNRALAGFHARGLNVSDQGINRQFQLLHQKVPTSQAKLVETLLAKNQRLYAFEPSSLTPNQKEALQFIEGKSNKWINSKREALGLAPLKGALGLQATAGGAAVIGTGLLNGVYRDHLAPRPDHQVTVTALDWIRHPRVNPNNGRVDWNDYCEAYVQRVFAQAGHSATAPARGTAKEAYFAAKAAGLTRTDWKNLKGDAALWWDVRTHGHTAIALDKMGPDGKPLVAMTGSVLWYRTPVAKVITWTEMVRLAGHPTAFSVAWDPKRDQP